MDISVSKNKHLIELNNGELVDINELVAKLSKMQNLESDLYEANHRITDLLLILGDRDRMIELMVEHIYTGCDFDNNIKTKEQIKEYFEKRCKDAKD